VDCSGNFLVAGTEHKLRLGVRYSFLAGPKPRKRRRVGREVSILTP
jgi:hypothetical protein